MQELQTLFLVPVIALGLAAALHATAYLHGEARRHQPRFWLFFAATLLAALVFPWSLEAAPTDAAHAPLAALSSVAFFYLLGTGRFFTVLGALDTGSAFEGMGASREVQFSALVEPAIFVLLGFLVLLTGGDSLADLLAGYPTGVWAHHAAPLLLAGLAFFAILLSECCRVPFDDPETHLELTMIHEAMILDNAGPDLAFIHYGAALKFELLAAFLVAMLLPALPFAPALRFALLMGGVGATAVAVGIVESTLARMRFLKTPQVLLATLLLTTLGALLFVLF